MRTYRDLHPTFADPGCWSLPWILRQRARTHGESVYLDVPHQQVRLTYAQTLQRAQTIARALLRAGCAPGDRVLIMAANSAEVILSWFGSALAGLVEVPINTAYRGSFLEHQVRTTAPRAAVVDAELADLFATDAEALRGVELFYLVGEAQAVEAGVRRLRAHGRAAQPFDALLADDGVGVVLPEPAPHELASVFFTSGTTGLSKGVMMSHAQMTFFADECVSLTRLTDRDAYMSVGPLFHGNAQFLAAYPALIAGARFVLRQRFSASRWIDQIRDSGATVTNFVGVMMDWVYKQPPRGDDADNALRCVFAAPTATSILEPFQERFGVEAFVEVFGLTETSMPILSPYGQKRPPGAAGLLADEYFEVRLVDPDTDAEVAVGEVGELTVRARLPWTMCSGYYNMPEQTAAAQRNLWFHTGDGMRRDAEGWYYFVDRLKDAIRRRGENISSYEVEQAVLEHDAVQQCAAVAAPAATEAGEDEVALFVVAAPGSTPDTDTLRRWCAQRLPDFAMPEYITLVDELPVTPSGKIRKAVLREQAVRLAGGEQS